MSAAPTVEVSTSAIVALLAAAAALTVAGLLAFRR